MSISKSEDDTSCKLRKNTYSVLLDVSYNHEVFLRKF